ncbi:FeoA family protein [Ligilactobacillus acidipiscis]|nr:ferrous iron transport protein A [Ligilactobacillus acidipiscis]GAW63346.1 ferrous iron transporter A [Ligilactobacillus acidipiscis]GEN20279.1 iron transporter FeoA [Ligilactobacillus acidipiscis]
MATLLEGTTQQKYIITKVTGDHALTTRLAELGLRVGKMVTVVNSANSGSGLVIYLTGQRLAISQSMAEKVTVTPLDKPQNIPTLPLTDMPIHSSCVVFQLIGDKAVRKRLMDMGLTRNTLIQIYHVAPLGDPIELQVRGYKLSIRKRDAANILVKELQL